MKINELGLELIKSFEGCRLTAYQDVVGIWTIGYGSIDNVSPGMTITQEEAENRLQNKLLSFEDEVSSLVQILVNDNQFSALVSFCYNVGLHNLEKSHLLIKLNAADFAGAAGEFLKWNRAGGQVVDGLTRRRQAEMDLFLRPVA